MPRHLESEQQRLFVARFRLDPRTRDWPACAIPNGGRRSKIEASILKAEGVSAGAPDWVCFERSPMHPADEGSFFGSFFYTGCALEFKVDRRPSRITAQQGWWHERLRDSGWHVAVVTTAEEAWSELCHVYRMALHPSR